MRTPVHVVFLIALGACSNEFAAQLQPGTELVAIGLTSPWAGGSGRLGESAAPGSRESFLNGKWRLTVTERRGAMIKVEERWLEPGKPVNMMRAIWVNAHEIAWFQTVDELPSFEPSK